MTILHYSKNGVYQYDLNSEDVESASMVGRFVACHSHRKDYAKLEITRGTGESTTVHTYEIYAVE